MSNLDYFKKFIPSKEVLVIKNVEVWSYTRVSSKDQFEKNSSVESQITTNKDYAAKYNYQVVDEFGGTYESGKSDFTRKEFKRLIEKVEKSRKKPYAILVFKMSRFSRSGGNAIGLVNYLVETLGVHLIETSSGINTTTERGKASIYESLFHAYKENLERKEIIIPNMKNFLKKGKWFGTAPLGYDHYGPRVKNEKFLSGKQRLVINDDGKLLRDAFKWKASGNYSDAQIISKLSARGLDIIPQKLSKIWRKPFYCGISTNRMLEEPVKGDWEPLISIELFQQVQSVLDNNPSGYQHISETDYRPLTRLVKCDYCDRYLIGYVVKKKNLHYYKCPGCRGVSINAHTTPKAAKRGANDLFEDFLKEFSIDEKYMPLLKLQIEKIFKHLNENNGSDNEKLERQLKELESQFKQLRIRFGLGQIDQETYQITAGHLTDEIQKINKELNTVMVPLSNLEILIEQSLEKARNINKIWCSSDMENKRNLHKMLFPDGIYYNAEKHQYLTRKMNQYFRLITTLSKDYEGNKIGNPQKLIENSLSVAGSGVEPETFGL